jgi:hypothetical protein
MPIRINLLAEQQMAEEMRLRNPVKLACWLGGFAISLVLLYSLSLQFKISLIKYDVEAEDRKYRDLQTNNTHVLATQAKIGALTQKLQVLEKLSTNRFLWGSALNGFQYAMIDDIQVTHLGFPQAFVLVPETKVATRTVPAQSQETIRFTIQGKDYGPPSGDQIEAFKRSLIAAPYLRQFLTNESQILLKGRQMPQEDPQRPGRSFVHFTLDCAVLDKMRQ